MTVGRRGVINAISWLQEYAELKHRTPDELDAMRGAAPEEEEKHQVRVEKSRAAKQAAEKRRRKQREEQEQMAAKQRQARRIRLLEAALGMPQGAGGIAERTQTVETALYGAAGVAAVGAAVVAVVAAVDAPTRGNQEVELLCRMAVCAHDLGMKGSIWQVPAAVKHLEQRAAAAARSVAARPQFKINVSMLDGSNRRGTVSCSDTVGALMDRLGVPLGTALAMPSSL